MKLLVVGGSGFVGRNFLPLFGAGGWTVTATYRSDETFPAFVAGLGGDVRALRCELLDEANDFSGYDVALHLAGNRNHGWAGQHPDHDLLLNGVAMTRFLRSFRGSLVLLSSAAVYLGHEGLVSPATSAAPLFPYAISKLASELYARWAASTGALASCAVLRLYYAYGPGEEDWRLVRRALTEFGLRGARSFTINGDGRSLMGPIHVSDLVRALTAVVEAAPVSGVYDILGERPYTVEEIVRTAADVCDVEVLIQHRDSDEAHLGFYSDLVPFSDAFGFAPALTLPDGMREYLGQLTREAAG